MKIEHKIPSPGESIKEVVISKWLKKDGDYVWKDDELAEIESDKATLTLVAETNGSLSILAKEGNPIPVGAVACVIDTEAKEPSKPNVDLKNSSKEEISPAKEVQTPKDSYAKGHPSPAAKKMLSEKEIPSVSVSGTGVGGRITKEDVVTFINREEKSEKRTGDVTRVARKEKMSSLRKKLSQRLVAVKNQTAMLTTFNEVDMSQVMQLRTKYKESFKEKFGVNLGFMSFFSKAVTSALNYFPSVNTFIEEEEIVFHDYVDLGIAVSAPKGLMVPVIRNAESLKLHEIELKIAELAGKARDGKITIDEMTGGTFTITNGGVFGSMLSTPILNPPQSAILGMHNIVERPVAVNNQVVIRPIMYVALSYDHRIIDGRESVGFLKKVKEFIENPGYWVLGF
ncbi:MAG: 2-oxoglutarate dehydrogenase [Bacteroidetes bacterium RIFCSPLOWO2_12_FULL_37_12]|nr:MAG: 2-oxoglutarate dehydrogenase [Bacteroidetes bacterium RIFCSPLOWO2_12_FULL_37_12]